MNSQEYYKTAKLYLPKYPNWRIFKMRVDNGTKRGEMIKIKDVIRNEATLRKWLVRLNPLDAYYSCNAFLNPTQVRGNQTVNRIVYRETPFDFDAEKPYGERQLEMVRKSVIGLIKFVKEKYLLSPRYILFTGGKGFQVIYDYIKNLNMNELNFYGLDKEISTDENRVIRLPLTINKLGRVAVFLTESELEHGMDYILMKSVDILQDTGERAARLDNKPMTFSPRSQVAEESENRPNRSSAQAIYITNEVNGTNRFIPILKYELSQRVNPRREMNKLAQKYGLKEWFLVKTSQELYCFSLIAFDKKRLDKILNSTKSVSRFEFKKLRKIFMRVSSINDEEDEPTPCGVLYFETPITKQFIYSKPHLDLAKHFSFAINPFIKNYIGKEKPKIYLTTKNRGGV